MLYQAICFQLTWFNVTNYHDLQWNWNCSVQRTFIGNLIQNAVKWYNSSRELSVLRCKIPEFPLFIQRWAIKVYKAKSWGARGVWIHSHYRIWGTLSHKQTIPGSVPTVKVENIRDWHHIPVVRQTLEVVLQEKRIHTNLWEHRHVQKCNKTARKHCFRFSHRLLSRICKGNVKRRPHNVRGMGMSCLD
jgi:hypothetical protein